MKRFMQSEIGPIIGVTMALMVAFGGLLSCKEKGNPDSGNLQSEKEEELTEEQKNLFRQLRSIGYAAGGNAAPDRENVTVHVPERCHGGLNLVVSGHAPEVILMGMDGQELHTWTSDVHAIWPNFDEWESPFKEPLFFRRAHLLPGGDLLAIFDGLGLVKLDRDSNIIWATDNGAHHDLQVAGDGTIYVLTREPRMLDRYHERKPVLDEFVCLLDPQGKEQKRYSILELLEGSPFSRLTTGRIKRLGWWGDILHPNTLTLLEEGSGIFNPETVLLSLLSMNAIFAVNLEKESIYWAEFNLGQQHQPVLLTNGNVMVFQNYFTSNSSAVLEIDPVTRERVWNYGIEEQNPLFTEVSGSCQRLPNGNTLITESTQGRAIEVTAQKETVWEYINPERAGKNLDKIAQLFEVVRLSPDCASEWLDE